MGHDATIIGVTQKMYHVRLDNRVVTKAKHSNVQRVSAPKVEEDTVHPSVSPSVERSRPASTATVSPFSVRPNPNRAIRHWTKEKCERNIGEALDEIRRQTEIVAEFSERLRLLNLGDEGYSRV